MARYPALIRNPFRVILAFLVSFLMCRNASAGSDQKPYLVEGTDVLAGIARIDSLNLVPLAASPKSRTIRPVTVAHCTLLTSFGEAAPTSFSIWTQAGAYTMKQGWSVVGVSDPNELYFFSSASTEDVWYKVGDIVLLVATPYPGDGGSVSSHRIKYVRFLHSPLEDLDQRPSIQSGADTRNASLEFKKKHCDMTTKEIYSLIDNKYTEDGETLREITEEMKEFYRAVPK